MALLASASGTAKLLAGGTDLLIQMRGGMVEPALLVSVKNIAEMNTLANEAGAYRIGASMSCMALIENADFIKAWPGVTDAVKLIGSIQVKGRASVGGNVCNASPAADSVPALIAAGARAVIVGPAGRRELPVEEMGIGPGKNALAKGEIVTGLLYVDPDAADLHAHLNTVETPLNQLGEHELIPGAEALEHLNSALR